MVMAASPVVLAASLVVLEASSVVLKASSVVLAASSVILAANSVSWQPTQYLGSDLSVLAATKKKFSSIGPLV